MSHLKSKDLKVASSQILVPGVEVGKRIPNYKVLNQSHAWPSPLQELLKLKGRWRLSITLTGDIRDLAKVRLISETRYALHRTSRRYLWNTRRAQHFMDRGFDLRPPQSLLTPRRSKWMGLLEDFSRRGVISRGPREDLWKPSTLSAGILDHSSSQSKCISC
jgi:hypothetical protein